MADETPLSELVRQRDSLLALQEAMKNRLQNLSREEALEVESLSERAIHPTCSFDRKHSEALYEMALFPDQKIKHEACDYLMREGELTGAEYFAVLQGLPHALTGVENPDFAAIELAGAPTPAVFMTRPIADPPEQIPR